MERTFVMIKPDAVKRGLIGNIINKIENKGLKIIGMNFFTLSEKQAKELYFEHKEKEFFEDLIEFATSGPVITMIVEGGKAVEVVRNIIGNTDPAEALPGTIRGDYALDIGRNCVHAADSLSNAEREYSIFFEKEDIEEYERTDEDWVYE